LNHHNKVIVLFHLWKGHMWDGAHPSLGHVEDFHQFLTY
jgi:hypothetical protein